MTTSETRLTPMLEQYMAVKRKHQDKLILFRMGDFYETFFDDAVEVSKILGITLTSRNHGKEGDVPLAGIPHHALGSYSDKLTRAGRSFVIVEQLEDPRKAKGIVKRGVTEVVTPGTTLSETLLEEKRNNFLIGISVNGGVAGIAEADLSTGEFRVTEVSANELFAEVRRIGPAEVLAARSWITEHRQAFSRQVPGPVLTPMEDWAFGIAVARERLLEHFKVTSLKGFGAEELTAGTAAAGAVLAYLQENQLTSLEHIRRLNVIQRAHHLILDETTQRNLELFASLSASNPRATLIGAIDQTLTPMGGRLLRQWMMRPLKDIPQINARLDGVGWFVEKSMERGQVRDMLARVRDIERIMAKVCCGRAAPRELAALAASLEAAEPLSATLGDAEADLVSHAAGEMGDTSEVSALIRHTLEDDPPATLSDGGVIRRGVSADLDELREIGHGGKEWLLKLQATERERTGIPSLKVAFNRAFGYYIEISNAHREKAPPDYIRKQTLVNAERYITPELKEWESRVIGAEERAISLEYELFTRLRDSVAARADAVLQQARAIALVDVLAALAETAARNNYHRPAVALDDVISIENGRHPVVEMLLPKGSFVPNDTYLANPTDQIMIITGPNMAGKSTYLRQTGHIVILAHMGSWVPADKAHIGVVDRLFTRVGAHDNLAGGESTFLVEMHETANILNNATPRSLLLFDEVGRGTSTFDGLSLAWAIVEYLHGTPHKAAKTMFATHYHELVELEDILPRVKNYNVTVREWQDEVIFLRKIVRGGCDHSYGIHVAQMAGLPEKVIQRAREVLASLEEKDDSLHRELGAPGRSEAEGGSAGGDADAEQIGLFAPKPPPEHPIVEEIRKLDLMNMTPLEVMRAVDTWQRRLDGERDRRSG
ncbi:MAG TPA: DNA mismatch repair protein MutS [Candidatus Latescibacteria bacterium]|nr:DNA mismatch repair protein MutS [Candidatus Latescibacterota bacterium]